jgi:hypothetical protein
MRAVPCVSNERSDHNVQQAERQRLDSAEKLSRAQNNDERVCGYYENFVRRHDKDSVERQQQLQFFLFSETHMSGIFFDIIYLAE